MNDSIIPPTVRSVLARLARGADDRATALSVILLLRSLRSSCAEGVEIEVCAQSTGGHDGLLLTIEHPASGLWLAEIISVSMRTLREVFEEMPELLRDLERTGDVVRLRRSTPPDAFGIVTPVELPSAELVAATSRETSPGEI